MNKLFTRFLLIALFAFMAIPKSEAKVQVGSTEYSTLAQAFAAVNDGTHSGNVVMKITGDISETTRAFLNASGVGNADYNSVLIYPTDEYKISGNQSNALVELRGADNVTFDGRINQEGTTNGLTIQNNSTSTHAVIWLDSNTAGGGGASNNTIRNINLIGGHLTACYGGVVMSISTSLTSTGAGNDNNTIAYCTFKKAYMGIRAYGVSTSTPVKNLKVYGNKFGSSDPTETITLYGMYLYYTKDMELYDNVMENHVYASTIYGIFAYYGSASKIYNNTFRNFQATSQCNPIYIFSDSNVEIYGNTIDNMISTGSGGYGIYLSSCSYAQVYDNVIKNLKLGPSTVGGIYMSSCSYADVYDNTIDNLSNSSTMYGIYATSSTYSNFSGNRINNLLNTTTQYAMYFSSCSYSTFDNNRITNTYNSGSFYGMFFSSCTYSSMQGNYMDNFNNSNGSSYAIYLSSSGYSDVNYNRIGNQYATVYSYGIYFTTVPDTDVIGNEIFGMIANGTSTTGAWGIFITGTSNNCQIINNSIANIRTTQWSTSGTTTNPFGIALSGGTGYKIWHNSVQLSGEQIQTGTQGTLSACLMISSTGVNTINLRNNNFSNTLVGLSGSRSFCIYLSSTSNLTNSTMDYNNYYAGGPYGMIGYLSSNRIDLDSWKSATSRETNSMNLFTEFNSINNNSPIPGSLIINKGTAISEVIYDILGNQRSSTNPTPGAYENAADILPPDITMTELTTTTSTDNPVIVATIKDYTGVNKTNSAPRLYYRAQRHSNAWVGNNSNDDGWKYATASINGDQYTFTLDYNKLDDGLIIGDVIEYFIVAQDVAPTQNLGTSKGFFSVKPNSTDLNAQNFPYYDAPNYRVAYGIEGDVKVGSGEDYETLTDEGGLFEFLNQNVVTGELNILITSDISETGKVILGKLSYEGAPYYNVNIRPSEAKVKKLSGAINGSALITLRGANYVNFDGSYDGEGRYLEITNTNSSGTYAVFAVGSGGAMIDGGKFITIQNCIIYSSYITSTNGTFGILVTDGAVSTSGTSPRVNDFTIRNNHIYKVSYGIYARALSTTGNMFENLLIEDNEIGNSSSGNGISVRGIDVMWLQTAMIRRNTVHSFATNLSTNYSGIEVGGSISNYVTLDGNRIYNIKSTSSSGYGAYGINITGGSSIGYTIMNNFISEISTTRYSSSSNLYNPFGIRIAGGNYHKFWHNTIYMTGQQTATGSQPSLTANIAFTSTYYYHQFIGNIFHNSLQGLTNTRSFNIFVFTTSNVMPNVVFNADYNNYTVGGAAGIYGGYGTSQANMIMATSLTAWKNMTTRDANSFSAATLHISSTDLHLNGSSIGNSGIMIPRNANVMYDGDGELRNSTTYVGADEVIPYLDLVKETTFDPQNEVYCIDNYVDISFDFDLRFGDNVERSGLSAIDITWFKNGSEIGGAKSQNIYFEQLKMADSAKYYATVKFMDVDLVTQERLLTVEAPIVITQQPTNADVCSADPILTLTSQSIGNIYGYQWEFRKEGTSQWMPMAGKTAPEFTMPVEDRNDVIGDYRLKIMGPGNCGPDVIYSDMVHVIVSDPLHSPMMHFEGDLYYTCVGEDLVLHATGEGSIYGYRWQRNVGQGFIDISVSDNPTAHTHTLRLNGVNPDHSGEYRCMIIGSASCGTEFIPTQSTQIRVWPFFILEEQPKNHIVCQGEEVILKVFAEGTIYRYQWTKNGIDIPLEENFYADKTIFIIPATDYSHSGIYQCRIYAEDCYGPRVATTDPAAVYVASGTEFTRKPTTQAVMVGNSINWVVRAHVNGAPPSFQPKVQWFRGNNPILESPKHIGTKSNSLIIANVQDADFGDDYWVVVYGLCGNDTVRNFGLVKSEFAITDQPVGTSVCQGEYVSFSVTAYSSLNEPISYRWFKDGVALLDDADFVGTHTNTLIVNNSRAELNGEYYCEVKVPSLVYGLNSIIAELNVTDKPAIVSDLEQIINLAVGDELRLEVQATGTDLTYQWYYNTEIITDATEPTYVVEEVEESNTGDYYVVITNECGVATSEICVVTVASSPSDVTIEVKDGYSLGVAVPNPVNATSYMSYTVPSDGFVEIVLINQLGVEMAKLVETRLVSGEYQLAIDANALRLTSGMYSVVMRANGVQLIQRLAVVK